jgi:hypothetical protein
MKVHVLVRLEFKRSILTTVPFLVDTQMRRYAKLINWLPSPSGFEIRVHGLITEIIGCGLGLGQYSTREVRPAYLVTNRIGMLTGVFARIPPNLRFRVPRDFESHVWSLGEESWDLIHVQQACGSVSSWPELYQKIYQ